jgi:hypothetical protein
MNRPIAEPLRRGAALPHDSFPSIPHNNELPDFLAFSLGGKGLNSPNKTNPVRREFSRPEPTLKILLRVGHVAGSCERAS